MKQEKYPVADYQNKTALWQHLEPAICELNNQSALPVHVAYTMDDVIKKCKAETLPDLAASTRNTQNGQLNLHIGARWGSTNLTEIQPGDVEEWMKTVELSQVSKGHVVVLMRRLCKLAMK